MSSIQSAVSLDTLQVAVAQVIWLSYHSLRLHKFLSPALFVLELSELLIPHLSFLQLFFLSYGVPLSFVYLSCF